MSEEGHRAEAIAEQRLRIARALCDETQKIPHGRRRAALCAEHRGKRIGLRGGLGSAPAAKAFDEAQHGRHSRRQFAFFREPIVQELTAGIG